MLTSGAKIFFFQAEDGIRDDLVTGVQTCALPICTARDAVGRSFRGVLRWQPAAAHIAPAGYQSADVRAASGQRGASHSVATEPAAPVPGVSGDSDVPKRQYGELQPDEALSDEAEGGLHGHGQLYVVENAGRLQLLDREPRQLARSTV